MFRGVNIPNTALDQKTFGLPSFDSVFEQGYVICLKVNAAVRVQDIAVST
jgi:hypothetical protein